MSSVDVALSPLIKESGHFSVFFRNKKSETISPEDCFILIYLSFSDCLIPMRVLESDSIASVKLRIQTFKGFAVKKQKLVFEGRELARNDSLVKDYGVNSGNVLHLVLKLSDLLLITVRTTCGLEFHFQVHRYRNVGYVKERIFRNGEGFVDVGEQEIFYNGERLDDQKLVTEICDDSDATIHLVAQKTAKVRTRPLEKDFEIHVVAECCGLELQPEDEDGFGGEQIGRNFWWKPLFDAHNGNLYSVIQNMVSATYEGLARGNPPIRSFEGTGGTYFMRDPLGQEFVSIFKPSDEEPNAMNNPRNLPAVASGEGLKKGTRVGEGAIREVAAFLLDHPLNGSRESTGELFGFAGVPPTVIVRCLHEAFNHPDGFSNSLNCLKIGSLQMFMKNDGNCDDVGPASFPVNEVHKISVFDIRMANADRHAGNILVNKMENGKTALIPIDHGYCLPENFEDCTFDWLYWPQARHPFSPEVVTYVKSLDAEHDIELLRSYGWNIPLSSARTLRISTMLLKKGVARSLTAYDIGRIMCREIFNKKSIIEEIIDQAQESLFSGFSEAAFTESVSALIDTKLDNLVK